MKTVTLTFLLFMVSFAAYSQPDFKQYQVIWDKPSSDSWGSMPVGNGDVGVNAWLATTGSLNFFIGKTDAWSENGRLLKIGKLKMEFFPNLFAQADSFYQVLEFDKGIIRIEAYKKKQYCKVSLWVDANHPVVHVDVKSSVPVKLSIRNNIWRTRRRQLKDEEIRSAYGLINAPFNVFTEPDIVVTGLSDKIQWCHRNNRSVYKSVLDIQALSEFADQSEDPLLNRTFGATVYGEGLKVISSVDIVSEPANEHAIQVWVQTLESGSLNDWKNTVINGIRNLSQIPRNTQLKNHIEWWEKFWSKHWIIVQSDENPDSVFNLTRGYLLQRYINACSGRGDFPIKFNGSIFNVNLEKPVGQFPAGYDADFRNWGGCYWFQNTRLPYWSMLSAGDFDMMKPLFKMYMDALPLGRFRTEKYYGHIGAYFPETMYFWGTWNNNNYGWNRTGKPDGLTDNMYIRYYWQSGIELITMMLDYYDHTNNLQFLKDTLLPFSKEILLFYNQHYRRNSGGKIVFEPSQSLETYWEGTINPMPEIAGLRYIIPRLSGFKYLIKDDDYFELCEILYNDLPEIPVREVNGLRMLSPGSKLGEKRNIENPGLYAVFPYRLIGIEKNGLQLGIAAYNHRLHKQIFGWQQDGIQAALLGLESEAKRIVLKNFNTWHSGSRFPAFWGPNYDWIPDQDHGSVSMIALQRMLVQYEGRKILLFPAWPHEWDVDFRVNTPFNTVITGKFKNGELKEFAVTPTEREKDITFFRK